MLFNFAKKILKKLQ